MACVLNFNWQLEEARRLSGVEAWYGLFDPHPRLTELLKAAAPQRIGVVGLHRLPVTAFEAIKTALPGVTFEDITSAVAFLRRQKSPLEARLLREAGRITDAAFDAIRTEIKPGMTEVEVAARLGYHMQGMGAELSFAPTVVSGNLDPIPIRMPTQRQLEIGDSVMIDMGAEYQGYQADASRTFVLGEPNDKQREVWETIVRAYDASLAKIRPGVPCNELHKAAVQVFTDAGYDLVHRVGHGIGLATSFEWPSLDTETSPLIEGMTFCLEPGIYVEGAGNMKYEDDVLVTKDGYELLTSSSNAIVVPV
jgi:Xaa-Pro dipeptidase